MANRPRKSSGSETTFAEDCMTPAEIEVGIVAMADDVWWWCEKAQSFGQTVTVKVKYADFRRVTRSQWYSACWCDAVQVSKRPHNARPAARPVDH
jgi:DNA polymerase-4